MALFKAKYFKVETNGTTRFFRAMREAHVRSHLASEFSVAQASHDDMIGLDRSKITDLTQHPDGQTT